MPGNRFEQHPYASTESILDADVVLLDPVIDDYPTDDNAGLYQGRRVLSEGASFDIREHSEHWRHELDALLRSGKTVFVLLREQDRVNVHTGEKRYEGSGRSARVSRIVETYTNYRFMPVALPALLAGNGTAMQPTADPIAAVLFKALSSRMRFEAYFEGTLPRTILVTKSGAKAVGAVLPVGRGHIVLIPPIGLDDGTLCYERGNKEYWRKAATTLGHQLLKPLVDVDTMLRSEAVGTPPPAWASSATRPSRAASRAATRIEEVVKAQTRLSERHKELLVTLEQESRLDALLYGTGKELERAVTDGLRILGYQAEELRDGDTQFDQVIVSPAGDRFIGECEGKDDAAVNIGKFRQLQDNIQVDAERNEAERLATGILFGNGYRLTEPAKRPGEFTTKCAARAASTNTALVRTADLYIAATWARDSGDPEYAKQCRAAVLEGKGKLVRFPPDGDSG